MFITVKIRYKILKKRLSNLYRERLDSFKTKYRKLATLLVSNHLFNTYSDQINLSSNELTSDETNQFKFGLHYNFVDKMKILKTTQEPTLNLQLIKLLKIQIVTNRKIFTSFKELIKKVYATTDYTYKHLKRIIKDPNFEVVSGYKE